MFCSLLNCLFGCRNNRRDDCCEHRSLLSTINPNCCKPCRRNADPSNRAVAGDLNSVFSNCDRMPFSAANCRGNSGCGGNCGCGGGNNCCCKCAEFFP